MNTDSHISIIINPFSGNGFSSKKYALLKRKLAEWKFNPEFYFIRKDISPQDFILSEIKAGSKFFVAIGGDGTVNLVARHLIDGDCKLCIIPNGSGNGLARHLDIPRKFSDSISMILSKRTKEIDYGLANEVPFFCTSGLGFDARVAHLFSEKSKRGFINYLKIILKEFIRYKGEEYRFIFPEKKITVNAFLITIANAAQYGNNAFISPESSLDDGLLDLCRISRFPSFIAPILGLQLISKRIGKSKYYDMTRITEVTIKRKSQGWIHIDGDPIFLSKTINYRIVPGGLNILLPD